MPQVLIKGVTRVRRKTMYCPTCGCKIGTYTGRGADFVYLRELQHDPGCPDRLKSLYRAIPKKAWDEIYG